MYDSRRVIKIVVDKDSWFEIGALWGTTAICGLARIDGYSVGIIASDPEVNAGAIDAAGSQKLTKHLKFLDVFNIPLVQFIDIPGYAIGIKVGLGFHSCGCVSMLTKAESRQSERPL
jgi:acetyl-CoA carboxylase carboxyltransferase component